MARPARIDDLYAIRVPEAPALAPDTRRIAYVLAGLDRGRDRTDRRLWMAFADGSEARPITTGPDDSAPAWSPDGTHIAFLRTERHDTQMWLLTVESGLATPLTALSCGVGRPTWSPDGRRIAFVAGVDRAERADDRNDAVDPASRPMVTDRLDYQSDGAPWPRDVRQHVHVLEPFAPTSRSGAAPIRRLTDGDWNATAPAWSPDGTRLAFTANTDPDSDLTMTRAVHVVTVDDEGATAVPVGPSNGHLSSVTWIDHSSLLAGGRTDTRTGHDSLWRIDIGTGRIDSMTAALDRDVMRGSPGYPGAPPQVVDDGRTILFCARERGCTHLYSVPVTGGTPRTVVAGAGRVVTGMSAFGARVAMVLATPGSFGEVYLCGLTGGDEYVCTSHGSSLAGIELRERRAREFVISDGVRVQGWLLRDSQTAGPQPLLLDIHGGPHNAWNGAADAAHLYHQVLVSRGWTVLVLNPRASDGYGEAFYTSTGGAWGRADAPDLLEPIDQLVAEGIVDPARLAVTGYSYGGYMACYLTAHDGRFAAAVIGGPVADLVSQCGTSDDGHFLSTAEMTEPWWSDASDYLRSSPLTAVSGVRTPTLILQGDDDIRCPRGQAQQWFTALRERRVPTRLVLYPDASHLFPYAGRGAHRVDYQQRLTDWVLQYAGTAG